MLYTSKYEYKGNVTYIQVDGEPLLLTVSYGCDPGFEAHGPIHLLCVNDSVFEPSTPPMFRSVMCNVPYYTCPNDTTVKSHFSYFYQPTKGIACQVLSDKLSVQVRTE